MLYFFNFSVIAFLLNNTIETKHQDLPFIVNTKCSDFGKNPFDEK